jgi:signal transduction histidine kinase
MRARSAAPALFPIGVAFGVAAEWTSYDSAVGPFLTTADFAVGCLLIGCGVTAWSRRPESRVGALMNLAGLTWFLGTAFEAALYLHRGPLVHLQLSYPTGRLRTRLAGAVVGAAYIDALVEPLASNGVVTLVLSTLVAVAAISLFRGSSGPARRAGRPALAAALAFAAVLALGAVNQLTGSPSEPTVLWTYDVVIAGAAIMLTGDLLRSRWSDAVVAGLVVELGSPAEAGTLRAKLARALGDPSLVVGYRVSNVPGFVDEAGRPVELPRAGSGKTVTPLVDRGEQIAILVHDELLMADSQLVESVAAAARIAVANAALQAEGSAQAAELEASRRRILEAADTQRRRLEQELRLGAGQRLEEAAILLAEARGAAAPGDLQAIEVLEHELAETRGELEEFARGMHPAALMEHGLTAAVTHLAARSPLPVVVRGNADALPPDVEAALFFVCAEGVTNAVKHARASQITIDFKADRGVATVVVADDGGGGASTGDSTGLRGLADRIEAVGGRFAVESPPGAGTRLTARIGYDVKTPASTRTGREAGRDARARP